MSEELQDTNNNIESDYRFDRQLIEEQIEHIKLIEQKINSLILDLESANMYLQSLLKTEKDPNKKKNLHTTISFNIDKLTKLYQVLREYQDTKFKYLNAVSDSAFRKNKLIYLDLAKTEKVSDTYAFFNKLMSVMSDKTIETPEIDESEEYKL